MVILKREGSDESELCDNGPRQLCSCVQELDQRRKLLLESGEETEEMAGVKQGFRGWQEPGLSRAAFPRDSDYMCTTAHQPQTTQSLSQGVAMSGRLRSCHLPGENFCSRRTLQEVRKEARARDTGVSSIWMTVGVLSVDKHAET